MMTIELAGEWRVRLDRADVGLAEAWAARAIVGEGALRLPGSLQEQGYGDAPSVATRWTGTIADRSFFTAEEFATARRPESFSLPFWLTPLRHYVGVAWVEREIEVPATAADGAWRLELERGHWWSRAWVDGTELTGEAGSARGEESLHTPQRWRGPTLAAGRQRLTLRLDNRLHVNVGENAHSVSDHTQTNWLGVIGRMELVPWPASAVEHVEIFPAADARSVRLRWHGHGVAVGMVLVAEVTHGTAVLGRAQWQVGAQWLPAELTVDLAREAPRWDEFSPVCCAVRVELRAAAGGALVSGWSGRCGFRALERRGRHLFVNGRRLFLRGTLDCAVYPLTGYPPMAVEEWRRIFGVIRAHGLNHVRFHSWCPPEAAFAVADELGLYLQVECGTWTEVGSGGEVDRWIEREGDRILAEYGNHPSFCFLAHGNEPQGARQAEYLTALVERWRAADGRQLYTGGAGWPELAANDFHVPFAPRAHGWTAERLSRFNALPPETACDYRHFTAQQERPVVSHEIGQWCAFPNLRERAKYRGVVQAKNFDLVAERLAASGQLGLAEAFLQASGKLQAACYKEEIEAALRTPDMGGFQLLGLSDFPGQGTALVGVLDAFWEEKGYIAPEEWRQWCGPTVALLALPRRVATTAETLGGRVLVAHYGARPAEAVVVWRLRDEHGVMIAQGDLGRRRLEVGLNRAGDALVDCGELAAPARYVFEIEVAGVREVRALNRWHVWVYPETSRLSAPGVLVHDRVDRLTLAALARGETVILSPGEGGVASDPIHGPVKLGWSPIFWNTAWTLGQAPHTLGVLCDPAHPALAEFPTESHSDWQWWYVVSRSQALVLDALPRAVEPLVRAIDDWANGRRLALAFEARVAGGGRVIATGVELRFGHESNPVSRQLLSSLLGYAASDAFRPQAEISVEQLRGVYAERGAFDPL